MIFKQYIMVNYSQHTHSIPAIYLMMQPTKTVIHLYSINC